MRNMKAPGQRTELYDRTWLQKARALLDLTQADVAKACDIATSHYNRIEAGVTTPNVKVGVMIADVLGVDVHNFLTERRIA